MPLEHRHIIVGTDYTEDVAGNFMEKISKRIKGKLYIEVQEFENKNARMTLLKVENRTKALVVEIRTEFNNVEFICSELK